MAFEEPSALGPGAEGMPPGMPTEMAGGDGPGGSPFGDLPPGLVTKVMELLKMMPPELLAQLLEKSGIDFPPSEVAEGEPPPLEILGGGGGSPMGPTPRGEAAGNLKTKMGA